MRPLPGRRGRGDVARERLPPAPHTHVRVHPMAGRGGAASGRRTEATVRGRLQSYLLQQPRPSAPIVQVGPERERRDPTGRRPQALVEADCLEEASSCSRLSRRGRRMPPWAGRGPRAMGRPSPWAAEPPTRLDDAGALTAFPVGRRVLDHDGNTVAGGALAGRGRGRRDERAASTHRRASGRTRRTAWTSSCSGVRRPTTPTRRRRSATTFSSTGRWPRSDWARGRSCRAIRRTRWRSSSGRWTRRATCAGPATPSSSPTATPDAGMTYRGPRRFGAHGRSCGT